METIDNPERFQYPRFAKYRFSEYLITDGMAAVGMVRVEENLKINTL
jgi:hypothetical protein